MIQVYIEISYYSVARGLSLAFSFSGAVFQNQIVNHSCQWLLCVSENYF